MVTLGSGLTFLAFALALYGAWTALQAGAQYKSQMLASALRSAMALFVVTSFLVSLLLYAFITHDFSIKYVVSYSDSQLPLFYTIFGTLGWFNQGRCYSGLGCWRSSWFSSSGKTAIKTGSYSRMSWGSSLLFLVFSLG